MLGTGLSASSFNESTIPSTTSSSATLGTYCVQIGSPGDLISSTMAGEIRNSKFSAACLRRSSSGKFSAPNLWASASSEAMEFFLRTSCQVSAMEPPVLPAYPLHQDHLIIARCIEIRDGGYRRVAPSLVERAGCRVIGPSRCVDDDEPGDSLQPSLHLLKKPSPDAGALHCGIDSHPVEIVGTQGAWSGSPAYPPHQPGVELSAKHLVGVGNRADGGVEDFERHRYLIVAEPPHRTSDFLDAAPVGGCEVAETRGDEGAAQAADTPLTRTAAARWL